MQNPAVTSMLLKIHFIRQVGTIFPVKFHPKSEFQIKVFLL